MKAAVLYGIGNLKYTDVPLPSISSSEALVKVKACGICNSDVPRVKTKGAYHYPIILGHEFSGEVVEIDEKENIKKGTKVVVFPLIPCKKCIYCQVGEYAQCDNYNYLGSRTDGGFEVAENHSGMKVVVEC